MAGAKRRTPYRKQVTDRVLNEYPEPAMGQSIVRVICSHGSNIFEVCAPAHVSSGETGLAMLPTKFRKLVWVKRGDFLIVSEAAGDYDTSAGGTGRVRYMIEAILYAEQIKHLRTIGIWPPEFGSGEPRRGRPPRAGVDEDEDDEDAEGQGAPDDEIPMNRNRRWHVPDDDDDDEDDADDDGDGDAAEDAGEDEDAEAAAAAKAEAEQAAAWARQAWEGASESKGGRGAE